MKPHPSIRSVAFVPLALFLAGCPSTTLLSVKFDADAIGSAPGPAQAVGTLALDNGSGSIVVVDRPDPSVPATKWVRIAPPASPSPQTSMRGQMTASAGNVSSTLLIAFFIPDGTGVVTVQLEPFGTPESSYFNFIHVDLMPDGSLRVNDAAPTFGHYPHGQVFLLSMNTTVSASAASVHIGLVGSGTSGSRAVTLDSSLVNVARQFGAVRIWMGFQHQGQFFADDVLVTKPAS